MPGRPLEKVEERKFAKRVELAGHQTIKLTSLGRFGSTGWPDRLILIKGGGMLFMEFKRKGGKVTRLQKQRHRTLKSLGFKVYVVYSAKEAWEIFEEAVHTQAVSKGKHSVRRLAPIRGFLSGTGVGKNVNKPVHIQDTEKARARRRADGTRKAKNRVRRMA